MQLDAKVLRGATLASILSACVVPGEGDVPETEAVDQSLEPRPTANASPPTVNCFDRPIVDTYAYTGRLGQAICLYGYTFVNNYANQIHRFVVGTNYRVYHTWQNITTGAAGGWEDQGGFATTSPKAGRISGGGLQICVIGNDGVTVYSKKYFPGTGWGAWTAVNSFNDCSIEWIASLF